MVGKGLTPPSALPADSEGRECLSAGDGGRRPWLLVGKLRSGMLPGTQLWDGPDNRREAGKSRITNILTCHTHPIGHPALGTQHLPRVPEPSPASCPWAQPRAGRTAVTLLQTERCVPEAMDGPMSKPSREPRADVRSHHVPNPEKPPLPAGTRPAFPAPDVPSAFW